MGPLQLMFAQNKTKTLETARGPQGYCNYLMAAHGAAKVEKILLGEGWSSFLCLNQRGIVACSSLEKDVL